MLLKQETQAEKGIIRYLNKKLLVQNMYDFKHIEEKVAQLWKKHEAAIKKSLQDTKGRPLFAFLEGPPTANAPPALHHVEVRVFKDLFCRFKYMQGFSVPRKGGWDCHGLPVEVQIEKKLGLNSKKEIVHYGIDKFIKQCRESVFEYIKEWNRLTEKMAYWVDLENPYRTLDNEYIESVWWSLKELYTKGLLYESHKVVPLCPRCETPLSSHEVAQGYKDVAETAVTVKFRMEHKKNRYFLAWTTTPWTLLSNVALAVQEKLQYAVVEQNGEEYVLAKDLVQKYFENPVIKEEIVGKNLKGMEYEPLFSHFVGKLDKPAWKVVLADFVTTDEGTGIVHIAGAFGEDDYEVCKENNLAFIQPVKEDGKFTEEIPEYQGMFVKDTDYKIIKALEEKNDMFKKEKYMHSYPYCWRCSTPLIYYATMSWFVRVTELRDELIKNNENICWVPSHLKEGRFGNWLENVKDWALSRNKFWGTPLPIWRCDQGHEIAIGGIAELKEKANESLDGIDLHKPYVDKITIDCNRCKSKMWRVPDVIDCWYDSGAASFAQYHYPFENKELFEKSFPYSFIAEALDQTRGWFYTLHALGTLLFHKNAYQHVVCAGLLLDEKGEKMSKSKGNIVNPWDVFNAVGIDAVRLQFCATEPGDAKKFGVHTINQAILPFLKILWNCYLFVKPMVFSAKKPKELEIEDRWLISKTNSVIREVTEEIENHNYHKVSSLLTAFVNDDLSRWYIKLIRDRANEKDESLCYVFWYVFDRVLRLLAPLAPYITEYIYDDLFKRSGSIHLESLPKEETTDKLLEEQMKYVREIVTEILAQREKANIGVRWPLQQAIVKTAKKEYAEAIKRLGDLVKQQTNLKKISVDAQNAAEMINIILDTTITPELEAEGFCRELCRKIQSMRKEAGLKKEDRISLVIAAEYDLESFAEEIKEKVGAKDLKIAKDIREKRKYAADEKIRGKTFTIDFDVIQ